MHNIYLCCLEALLKPLQSDHRMVKTHEPLKVLQYVVHMLQLVVQHVGRQAG